MNSGMNIYKSPGAGKVQVVNSELDRYRLLIAIVSFLAILGMVLCTIEHELYIIHGKDTYTEDRRMLLIFNCIITVILVL